MAGNRFTRNIGLAMVGVFMAAVAYLDGPVLDTDTIGFIVLAAAIAAVVVMDRRGGRCLACNTPGREGGFRVCASCLRARIVRK